MTTQEILELAIEKALSKNWLPRRMRQEIYGGQITPGNFATKCANVTAQTIAKEYLNIPNEILFDQEFAKALWGEEKLQPMNQAFDKVLKSGWKRHLQQMVVADDPIKYLGDNLES